MFYNVSVTLVRNINYKFYKMEELRMTLEREYFNYLRHDQLSDDRFHSPFEANKKHWEKVRYDAKKMADIAIRELRGIN